MVNVNFGDADVPSRRGRILIFACIVLLALNLRIAVGSLGVLVPDVRQHFGLSVTVVGLLTTLPVLCFSLFGSITNGVVRSIGIHRTALLSLAVITIGLVIRAVAATELVLVGFTAVALAGAAIGNVILPPLTKLHFPDHVAAVSAAYGAALMTGATLGSGFTVPLANLLNGWRGGLGIWAVVSIVALILWLNFARHDVKIDAAAKAYGHTTTARSPLAWIMAGFFGLQSAQAYVQFGWLPAILTDSGMSAARAGVMLAVLSSIGIPMTLLLPRMIHLVGNRPILPIFFGAVSFVGWLGILLWPTSFTLVWVVLLGLGGTAFTWVLTMMGRKTRTHDGTGALSGFVQSTGYLIAAAGPFGIGLLHDVSGSWHAGLITMAVLATIMSVLGVLMWRWESFEETIGR